MKITREEFKEYVNIYIDAWNKFDKYADIIEPDFLDSLMFPLFQWLDEKLGLIDDGSVILDFIQIEDADWDKVYDYYIGGKYDVFNV